MQELLRAGGGRLLRLHNNRDGERAAPGIAVALTPPEIRLGDNTDSLEGKNK